MYSTTVRRLYRHTKPDAARLTKKYTSKRKEPQQVNACCGYSFG